MLSPEELPVHGRVDGEGRLLAADEALAGLHARAGGEPGGPLAIPQLAALARLSKRLGIPIARMVLAADGERDLDLWVRARPENGDVTLVIAGWTRRPPAPPIEARAAGAAEHDFLRAEADWVWETDASLRLLALSSEGMAELAQGGAGPPLGEGLTRLFLLEEAEEGGLPLLEALAERRPFDDQHVTLRGSERRYRLAGTPLTDPTGTFTGFRGGGFAVPDPLAPAAVPSAEPAPASDAFTRRLDAALRAPLNRIVASAETIREQEEGPVRADYGGYAVDIASAGRHLLGLIDDLVDLEAVERADFTVEPDTLDLADVARRAAGLLSVRADDRRITIERPPEGETMPATGDFRRVLQILVNLVSNAVRFAPEGSTVRVIIERRGAMAAAVVSDEGRGIPPAERERVFAKFERLGAAEPGSGLGLYIARRLARAMGGDLVFEDQPAPGARAALLLPGTD
ncbi:MAG TPA: HAMP domain-containing sensor histidine kinase [Sphingomonas sp.]|nr:HAMP domain-containing sensor histidine kinase [Sphingomonas sp.]